MDYAPSAHGLAALGAAAWLTVGCAFVDPHADDATACSSYAQKTCARLQDCSSWLVETNYGSVTSCTQTLADSCTYGLTLPDILSSALGVSACGDIIEQVTCSQLLNRDLPAGCAAPAGRRSDGAQCEADLQCASTRCKKNDKGAARGRCDEPAPRGAPCLETTDCQDHLICASNNLCVALGTEGAACDSNQPCSYPLSCVGDTCTAATTGAGCSAACAGPVKGSPVVLGTACQAYADDLCTHLDDCSPVLVAIMYGDAGQCSQGLRDVCERSAAAQGVLSTSADIISCGTALQTLSCEQLLNHNLPDICVMHSGTRANGSACSVGAQCMSTRCALQTAQSCGTCQALAAESGGCLSEADCQLGLVCSSLQVCTRPGTKNEGCSARRPCAFPWMCAGGTCKATLAHGANCDTTADRCDEYAGDVCGTASKVCESLQYAAAGAPCAHIGTGRTLCERSASCEGDTGSQRCVPAAEEGQGCADSGPHCAPPARCVNHLCSLIDPSVCP